MSSIRMQDVDGTGDEAEVTWEDQSRINTFSKLNTRLRGIKEKIEGLRTEKETLDDLSTELELADEDEPVLYKLGESFLHLPHSKALKRLENDQKDVEARLGQHLSQADACEKEMRELKVVLYAKFGSSINLDE
ncbi:subunit of the heterohexameric cochaperone prefoldin complex [Moniliophthora roreri MCA 2997]|uniref:Prefoldin subunit 4 n=2 Tax=Moniliophthora roreri TaxID=221103 RepID=V2W555_MONRO|nr:subunit of the heterohexameric cochaperone prefoldin complex [Moniliophthora roreri MCA 2997]KAI3604652.1 subunit of the heterohexameric cochaperone prefoldin complex [Moniliophthora roreri]